MRLSAACALFLALTPARLCAQASDEYQAAVAAREAGKPAEAGRLLRIWLAAHPDDVDAQLQLAYSELALGNLDAAQRGFEQVLRQAPTYTDAQDGLALIAARRPSAGDTARGFLAVDGALSHLSGGAKNWRELAIEAEVPAGTSATIGARAAYYRRFGAEDLELVGRVGAHPSQNLWLRAHLGGTPGAQFRPKLSLGGGADLRLSAHRATVLTVDGAYERFPLQDVVTINPGLVQYFRDGRGWITLRGIATVADGGSLQVGGLLRGDFAPGDGWRMFAGAANGPDTDLGVVTRVTTLFGGVEAPVGRKFAITGSIGRDWREAGTDRTEFRLGMKTRF